MNPASANTNFTSSQRRDRRRIDFSFHFLNARMQGLRGVSRKNWHGFLGDDRAGINPLIDEMNSHACELHAVLERLLPGFEAGK